MPPHPHPMLTTPRLRLRPWRDADAPALAALNADPRVMEHFPAPLTREESDAMLARLVAHFDRHGFGMWAIELARPAPHSAPTHSAPAATAPPADTAQPATAQFLGLTGLAVPTIDAPFTPCVEIGWRLLPEYWGHGYATEAARAALAHGFDTLGLDEIVAYTTPANLRSRRVMQRLGMTRNPADDFHHPKVPPDHPLSRCVLYRLRRDGWDRTPVRSADATRPVPPVPGGTNGIHGRV